MTTRAASPPISPGRWGVLGRTGLAQRSGRLDALRAWPPPAGPPGAAAGWTGAYPRAVGRPKPGRSAALESSRRQGNYVSDVLFHSRRRPTPSTSIPGSGSFEAMHRISRSFNSETSTRGGDQAEHA